MSEHMYTTCPEEASGLKYQLIVDVNKKRLCSCGFSIFQQWPVAHSLRQSTG